MLVKIVYSGSFLFPEGDAAAARVLGIGKALREAGYDVKFMGMEEQGRAEDLQQDGSFLYQGFYYLPARVGHIDHVSSLCRLRRYLAGGKDTIEILKSINTRSLKAIIAYNPLACQHLRLQRFCLINRIPLVIDCTEWHAPTHYPGGRFGLHRSDVEITMRYLNPRAGNMILVSSYLKEFYDRLGVHTIRIPPLVDVADAKWALTNAHAWATKPLRLIYAGNPGRKDMLETILIALKTVREEGKAVVLEIVGPNKNDVLANIRNDWAVRKILDEAVIFHGHVSQADVPSLLAQAHIGLLIRPIERYANAGFPTKVVEYMAAGLPVIANATSDVAEYVRNDVEGLIALDNSPEAIASCIRRVISFGPHVLNKMGLAARQRADTLFDYRNYVANLSDYFMRLRLISGGR